MRVLKLTLMLLVLALGLPVLAETKLVAGNKQQETFKLKSGDTLQVLGNHNQLVADGDGAEAAVSVMGNHNEIRLQSRGGAADVTGNYNTIVADGNWSAVNVLGNNNTVKIVKRKGRPEPTVSRVGKNTTVEYITR